MDDLRDYRFYSEDMLHPNKLAIDYIWEKFQASYFNTSTIELSKRFEDLERMKSHRVFNPDTDSHKAFIKKIESLEAELTRAKNK
ncbi:MAG: GSCFA domain-containing protein, partial [Bacteroidales bacterium]